MKKLDPLTSLRFFAAVSIVLFHSKSIFHLTSGITSPIPLDYGVSFFFVLSGFILSYTYRDFDSIADFYKFYIARVARIWPIHIATFFLFIAIIPGDSWEVGGIHSSLTKILIAVSNILLIHSWIPLNGYFFSFNGVSWSLSVEVFFYVVFPFIFLKWNKWWLWKSIPIILGVCLWLTIATLKNVPDMRLVSPFSVSSHGIALTSPISRIFEFWLGMVMSLIFINSKMRLSKNFLLWTAIEVVAFFAIPLSMYCTGSIFNITTSHHTHMMNESAWGIYVIETGGSLGFAMLVLIMAIGRGAISSLLRTRVLVVLGEVSFALYMVHQLILVFIYIHKDQLLYIPDAVLCLLYWAISIGAAFALRAFIEKPCRTKLRSWLQRPSSALKQTASAA